MDAAVNTLTVPPDFSAKTTIKGRNPLKPGLIIGLALLVGSILSDGYFAQIFYAVIRAVSVNMVNLARRPFALNPAPDKVVQSYFDVACVVSEDVVPVPSAVPGLKPVTPARLIPDFASCGIDPEMVL